jgi:hypothetical protein
MLTSDDLREFADDPRLLKDLLWPNVRYYRKQWALIESVRDNDETYCYAAHQMGRDYVAGFIVLWGFITHPVVRIVTTSVKDDHLRVLWGEIGRYIDTSSIPLTDRGRSGVPCPLTSRLVVTHREIRKQHVGVDRKTWTTCKISYVKGMVSERGEGMAGHHAPWTLLVIDEASGVDPMVAERASSWAKKSYIFGNPYGDVTSWFAKACLGGDIALGQKPVHD